MTRRRLHRKRGRLRVLVQNWQADSDRALADFHGHSELEHKHLDQEAITKQIAVELADEMQRRDAENATCGDPSR